jgi:hypothetical protein
MRSPRLPTEQSGAVSRTVPEQLPEGPSVVTATPFTRQGTAPVEPPVQAGGSGQGTVFVTESPVIELAGSRLATVKLQLKGTPAAWALVGQDLVTLTPAAIGVCLGVLVGVGVTVGVIEHPRIATL